MPRRNPGIVTNPQDAASQLFARLRRLYWASPLAFEDWPAGGPATFLIVMHRVHFYDANY